MDLNLADPALIERAYRRDGFVRIPVFSPAEVRAIRDEVYVCFQRRHGNIGTTTARDLTSRDLLSQSKLLCAIVHPRITTLLKCLLGSDCEYLPDFEVHINQYGIGGGGWHLDCGSEIPQHYLLEPRYRFVKCGIYLQPNDPELAGGIDVLPGLHRWFPPVGSVKTRFRAQYVLFDLLQRLRHYRVPTAAGDFVAFDSRLPHRGTAPGAAIVRRLSAQNRTTNNFSGVIPPGRDKMVVYFDACRAGYARQFLDNSVRRAKAEIGEPWSKQYRAQYLGLQYPEDFPTEFREQLTAAGIRMAVYDGPEKSAWIEHGHNYQTALAR
jgi:hypothetical protein